MLIAANSPADASISADIKEDIESTIKMAVEVIRGLNDERIRHIMRQDVL